MHKNGSLVAPDNCTLTSKICLRTARFLDSCIKAANAPTVRRDTRTTTNARLQSSNIPAHGEGSCLELTGRDKELQSSMCLMSCIIADRQRKEKITSKVHAYYPRALPGSCFCGPCRFTEWWLFYRAFVVHTRLRLILSDCSAFPCRPCSDSLLFVV